MVNLASLLFVFLVGANSFAQDILISKNAVVKKSNRCDSISENLDSSFGKCGRLSPQDSPDLFGFEIREVITTSNGFYVVYNNWNHKLKVVRYDKAGSVAHQFNNNVIIDYIWDKVEFHAVADAEDNLIVSTSSLFGDDSNTNFKLTKILKNGEIKYAKVLPELRYSNNFSLTVNNQTNDVYVINRLDDYTTKIYAFDKNGNDIKTFGENGKIVIYHQLRSGNPENFYWSAQYKTLKYFAERTIYSIDVRGTVINESYLREYPITQSYDYTIFNDDGILCSSLILSNEYAAPSIFKILPSGHLDQSFASNGIFNLEKIGIEYKSGYRPINIFIDNKKLVYATYSTVDSKMGLIRLSKNGNLDKNFAGPNLPSFFFNSEKEGNLENIIFLNNNSPILLLQKGSPNYESAIYKLKVN